MSSDIVFHLAQNLAMQAGGLLIPVRSPIQMFSIPPNPILFFEASGSSLEQISHYHYSEPELRVSG